MNKNKIIGILPASGKAERISGIPKFLLPINDKETLLDWHIKNMSEVCDEIRISTTSRWASLVKSQLFVKNIKIYEIEPSTMTDACNKMIDDDSKYLIGMPDTYIYKSNNFYKNLAESHHKISVSVFNCYNDLKGKVGQVLIKDGQIIESIDKNAECNWEHMWGAMAIQNVDLNSEYSNIGIHLQDWIKNNHVAAILEPGKYIDLGTFDGIKNFYSTI